MKKIVFIVIGVVILSCALFAQSIFRRNANRTPQQQTIVVRPSGPYMTFERNIHDFGSVREEAGRISTAFEFTNTGNAPVIILRVNTGCPGCTFPTYPREPILPGQTSQIALEYVTSGRPGAFNRPVTVHTNVPDTVFTLFLRGTVLPRQ